MSHHDMKDPDLVQGSAKEDKMESDRDPQQSVG